MPVPDYQSLMLPTLKALSDGQDAKISEVRARVAAAEELKPGDLHETLPSGKQTVFANRVGWAVTYMKGAGLVEKVRRAVYRLTEEGAKLLAKEPERINLDVLRNYEAFVGWSKKATEPLPDKSKLKMQPQGSTDTPQDALDRAARQLRKTLEADVLDRVRSAPPSFLEQTVVDLLIAMGYGGGNAARGSVGGKPGDGGIDGTIREDALGLDEVYVQAKKYADGNAVGAGDLRNFAGAIDAVGTKKGVFVTTSAFTGAAKDYVKQISKQIVLIDGDELARLMVGHNVGVRIESQYEIKRLDEDYFE